MNRKEEFEQLIMEYRDMPVPQKASEAVEEAIARGKKQTLKRRRMVYIGGGAFGTCAAAAFVLLLVWLVPGKEREIRSGQPESAAGGVRDDANDSPMVYSGNAAQDRSGAGAEVAAVGGGDPYAMVGSPANSDPGDRMTEENCFAKAMECFEEEMTRNNLEATPADYAVLTNNDRWFTLAVYTRENSGENREIRNYYNIDKASCEVVTLAQLYGGTDNLSVIREEVSRQMKEMQNTADAGNAPKTEEQLKGQEPVISENQNYYFNDMEELVIVLEADEQGTNEAAAADAAGYREFVIPSELLPSEMPVP